MADNDNENEKLKLHGEAPVDGFTERFAKIMKRRREQEGYTPSGLASILGVSEEYIRAIERGERSPNTGLFVRIVLALKLDAQRLVYGAKGSRKLQRAWAQSEVA